MEVPTFTVTVFSDRVYKEVMKVKRGADLIALVSSLEDRPENSCSLVLILCMLTCGDIVRRRPSASQEESSRQSLDLGLPSLQNCEK